MLPPSASQWQFRQQRVCGRLWLFWNYRVISHGCCTGCSYHFVSLSMASCCSLYCLLYPFSCQIRRGQRRRCENTQDERVSPSTAVDTIDTLMHYFEQCQLMTLNREPYEGRLPLTSWWRKSSNMTVGQSSLIYLAHHCYD